MSIRPFTPAQEPVEDLERRTVGRERLLGVVAERLRLAATTRTRQHTLLVGPRGSGKTHLLQVALHRAQSHSDDAGGLAVARVTEDAVGLTSYVDLLRELARGLGVEVGRERDSSVVERSLLSAAAGRTLVIVIENLDRVFRSIGLSGQRDLRSWVETSGRVLILAATPALFDSVRDRDKPWFGGLIETPLDGLTAVEGRELLTRLASDRGDQALAEALQSERGAARIQAVSQLTAGSPRIWMVLSECLTVESLDELIPAVEGLVEGLVPYYQSLLWDLPDNHQAIVRQLAEGTSAAMTASEIAAETGLSQQTVSKALGLLKEGRWVRDEKLPDGDQRLTWYSLREPMLRHHFQWRATEGEPLRLIVDLLREWYDPSERRRHLSVVEPASLSETYLTESLRATPPSYDLAMNAGTPEALVAVAREWMRGGDRVYPAETGLYSELCAILVRDPAADIATVAKRRQKQHAGMQEAPVDLIEAIRAGASSGAELSALLQIAAERSTGDVAASLTLIAAGLLGHRRPHLARELLARAHADSGSALGMAIILEGAFWASRAGGDVSESLRTVSGLLPAIESALGPDDGVSLLARSNIASYTGQVGDAAEALRLCRELLPDQMRVLGPDDRASLITRARVAQYTGVVGDVAEALRLYRELLPDLMRVLGANDRDTLTMRDWVAYYTGVVGDVAEALRLCRELLPDRMRVLGPDDRASLITRARVAQYTGVVGDVAEALRLCRELLPDRMRVLGPDDRDTLTTRHWVAYYTGVVGDAAEALRLYRELLPDRMRVLGPDDRDTLTTRHSGAYYTGVVGDAAEALRLYRELLPDRMRVLGPDDRDTLTTRHEVAYYTGVVGDAAEALRLYRELLSDEVRVLGADDHLTVATRSFAEHWSRRAADRSGITKGLERARAGDQEARIRLPAELRPLADGEDE